MAGPVYDPKSLPQWMELDYFRRSRPLFRWLRWLTWSALFIALAGVAWSMWPANHHVHQAGPLTPAHAMFNNDCSKCHTAHFRPLFRLWLGDGGVHSVADETCIRCHAGPAHQKKPMLHIGSDNCASCHKEHRGKMLLARVADGNCTNCHSSLRADYRDKTNFRDVSSFASHPEFALWQKPTDTGNVHFNHKKHLDLIKINAGNMPQLKPHIEKLRALNCSYCHQTDAAGQYMKPINYDNHCGSCHPLQPRIVERPDEVFEEPMQKAMHQFAALAIPHPQKHETPATVRALLHARYLQFAQAQAKTLKLKTVNEPERPLPGSRRGKAASEDELGWVNLQMQHAERLLFDGADGCRRCHTELSQPRERKNGLPDLGTPRIPDRWYKHSFFNHHRHRMLKCTECHSQTAVSEKTSDVLMPSIADCRKCHGPAGGARSNCVECHTFHQRDGLHREGMLTIGDCTR